MFNPGNVLVPKAHAPQAQRLDIQGVRALAIILVVLYHANLPISGGFIGVDVFFVISGYFMTGILVDEITRHGRPLFRGFYARRVRRLLPALFVVTVTTLLVSPLLQSPLGDQTVTLKSSVGTSLFAGNIAAYKLTGSYFGAAGSLDPFLHMWSLGVEEQFYVFFPVFLFIVAILGRKTRFSVRTLLLSVCIIASVISFALSYAISEGMLSGLPSSLAFFMFPTRVWEFGVGAIACLLPIGSIPEAVTRWLAELGATIGLVLILSSSFLIGKFTTFPGVAALAPVLGTGAIFLAGRFTTSTVARILSWKPIRSVGNVSYSWYLWHWPAIVYARYFTSSVLWLTLVAIGSLGLSYLTYAFVENPFRRQSVKLVANRPLRLALGATILPVILGLAATYGAVHQWYNPSYEHISATSAPALGERADCTLAGVATPADFNRCTWSTAHSKGIVYVMGDSHAGALLDGAVKAAGSLGLSVTGTTGTACSATPYSIHQQSFLRNCAQLYEWEMDRATSAADRASLVVIAHNASAYTGPDGGITVAKWGEYLNATVRRLHSVGIPVLLVDDVPQILDLPTNCKFGTVLPLVCHDDRSFSESIKRSIRDAEERVARGYPSGVSVIDPTSAFCSPTTCSGLQGGQLLYVDNNHLSEAGSLRLTSILQAAMVSMQLKES